MLNLQNLDEETRGQMLAEIDLDVAESRLYVSDRLLASAATAYPTTLKEAAEFHDDEWLAERLRQLGFRATETYMRDGEARERKVPSNAADVLAEGEFNRFYARGLCLRVLASGGHELVIYRAKTAVKPRPESEAKLGSRIIAEELLHDLRVHIAIDTALGVPAGPNSGLSVMLPENQAELSPT